MPPRPLVPTDDVNNTLRLSHAAGKHVQRIYCGPDVTVLYTVARAAAA